ncbi:MAG: fumarate hydratase [Dehalococcoidia bacterium]|nr:fumarate hydratase [Dehalococcoidia bacterium]
MKEIQAQEVTRLVARLCQEANFDLPPDVVSALERAQQAEVSPEAREALDQLLDNARIAREESVPLCQDCGYTIIFLEVGQDCHIVGGDLYAAVQEGVRQGYGEGFLRKSIVDPPIFQRTNTGDNTPAVIHVEVVPGNRLRVVLMPKGGGSENMSALAMLTPAQGVKGVVDFVAATVDRAGSNPCPPVIVGVGIGGTADYAMLLAKKALLRRVGEPHPNTLIAELEKEVLERVNGLGIGAQGYGGIVTALAVHIETYPAHIASLPVAVSIQCHSARHREAEL